MKKILLFISILVLALTMTACGNSNDSNSIRQADLSEREKMMLSLGGSQYFAFDFSGNESYGYIKTWIEKYEKGKKIETFGKMTTPIEPGKTGMLVAIIKEMDNGRSDWTISISTGGSVSKGESTQENAIVAAGNYGSTTSINQKDLKIEGKEVALASIFYNSMQGGGSMSTLSNDYYNDPESHRNELEDIDLVFIVKSKFSKTEK